MTRAASIFITFALAATLPGCAGLTRLHQEVALKALIHKGYKGEATHVPPQYARDFERGWKQAYYNVSFGADPCPPSTPPGHYWTIKYQNAEGVRKISAWFAGYRRGVQAAIADCRPIYNEVPVGAICVRQSAVECSPEQPVTLLGPLASLPEVPLAMVPPVPLQQEVATELAGDSSSNLSLANRY